jgi:hypothetical protein
MRVLTKLISTLEAFSMTLGDVYSIKTHPSSEDQVYAASFLEDRKLANSAVRSSGQQLLRRTSNDHFFQICKWLLDSYHRISTKHPHLKTGSRIISVPHCDRTNDGTVSDGEPLMEGRQIMRCRYTELYKLVKKKVGLVMDLAAG